MSDLLKMAQFELEKQTIEQQAAQYAANKKKVDSLREKGIAALRAFLPSDQIWQIEVGKTVGVEGGHYNSWREGIELIVDGIHFGYGGEEEVRFSRPGKSQIETEMKPILALRTTCSRCGTESWSWPARELTDIACANASDRLCRECQEKEWAQSSMEDAAASFEDDGRWLVITWDGQIKSGRVEKEKT